MTAAPLTLIPTMHEMLDEKHNVQLDDKDSLPELASIAATNSIASCRQHDTNRKQRESSIRLLSLLDKQQQEYTQHLQNMQQDYELELKRDKEQYSVLVDTLRQRDEELEMHKVEMKKLRHLLQQQETTTTTR